MKSTETRVKECIAEAFGIDEKDIKGTEHLVNDYCADYIDLGELWMALEDEFVEELDTEVSDYVTEKCLTVQEIIDYFNSVVK